MSNINPIINDRIRYTLRNKKLGSLIITEPIGWDEDDKELSRHENYHGIFAKFSNSLKFILSGMEYIDMAKDLYGINEEIQLIREEKHPHTDVWTQTYSGFLDLSTWAKEKNQTSVKFNSGGLELLLKSHESEKVEIDRETSIDGDVIPPLQTINVELEGRRIFLKTKLEADTLNSSGRMEIWSDDGNERSQEVAFTLKMINKSHENAHATIQDSHFNSSGGMFFLQSDHYRKLRISFDFNFKWRVTNRHYVVESIFKVLLNKYAGENNDLVSSTTLFSIEEPQNFDWNNGHVEFDDVIELQQGESLSISFFVFANFKDGVYLHRQRLYMDTNLIDGWLKLDEDSYSSGTNTKAILAHELIERLLWINSNSNFKLVSNYFGRKDIGYEKDGPGAYLGFTHGFWVRGFDKLPIPTEGPPKIENSFKPLTTSFKNCINSNDAVFNIGIGIENILGKQVLRVEKLQYFYNKNVTIRLPKQVKNVKRSVLSDKYYSSLEFGFSEGGSYEEACGLDEYNVKSSYTTAINRVKNTYSKLSDYRADSYGMEFARRKQKNLNDTEDTSYDNKIWFLDLKKYLPNLYKERRWQDDFEVSPSGVFSPDTATNLRLSPVNCLLRHSWWFSAGLQKNLTDYIRYGSSEANSFLKTKLIGGNELEENGNIINSELNKPRFVPELIEFEHVCDFEITQKINGYTTIFGVKTPNIYGLIEFVNEKNEIEKGFLLNLKPNKKGNWLILKSY